MEESETNAGCPFSVYTVFQRTEAVSSNDLLFCSGTECNVV